MAYRGLAVEGRHQSILVSGESGAGKTETVKIVMSHLASVHSAASQETDSHHLVVQRVLDSHPLLEAFGNAKTVRNDNSSRFGKFIQMQFDVEDATTAAFSARAVPNCLLAGSTCETYLLEKSRVVGHEPNERTYHIFYQLLAAENKSDFWEGLRGKTNESFRYVGSTDTLHIEGRTDAERWDRTIKALNLLDIKDEKLLTLMRAVCVVLQLGNIAFAEDPEDAEKSVISSKDELTALATLMDVPEEVLEKALTYRTVVAGKGESYKVPLKVDRARDGCDAFAKEIYQQAFDWLVKQINMVTCAEENYEDASDVGEYGLVGLLDIFGFESFETNRFEQVRLL
jgi:myosin-5